MINHKDFEQPYLPPRKVWVECMGNNHNLVKAIIKRRNWFVGGE